MESLTNQTFEKMILEAEIFFNQNNFKIRVNRTFSTTNETVYFEPETKKTNNKRADFFDGMQIVLFQNYAEKNDWIFEVSEYQAGAKQNELHIYKKTKQLKTALKSLIKGNKQKPIEIYI